MNAEKINLPLRRFIEQKVRDNFKDIDFRRGTAFNDLYAKVAAVLQQPFRHELNILRVNQSVLNFDFMSSEDLELLLGNLFVTRSVGTRATGVVRIYFSAAGDYSFRTLFFSTPNGLRFRNINPIQVSVESLLPNRQEDGTYALDVVCEAEFTGSRYSVRAGEINLVEGQPPNIFRVENPEDFARADDSETNAMLFDKARRSISVRNLINDASIQTVLRNQFGFIRDIMVIGAGDPRMVRDRVRLLGDINSFIHVGGKTDVYIDTTSIRSFSLNVATIPENLVVMCIDGPSSSLLAGANSGQLEGALFLDPLSSFSKGGINVVIRGNILEVDSLEFGEIVTDRYEVLEVLGDSLLRVSAGIAIDSLDALIYENGNVIYDYIDGSLSSSVSHGDYLSIGFNSSLMVESVSNNRVFVTPGELTKVSGSFNVEIPFDPDNRSVALTANGIGGVTATADEVDTNDMLYIPEGPAGGRWNVINRVSSNEIWVARNVAEINVTFGSGNAITSSDPISEGDNIIIQSTGETFEVISVSTDIELDRAHGMSGTETVWRAGFVISSNIDAGDVYSILKAAERVSIEDFSDPISIPAITSDAEDGDFFVEYASGDPIRIGDHIIDLSDNPHTVIGLADDGTNLYAQISPQWAGGTIVAGSEPDVRRFELESIGPPSVLVNRSVANSEALSAVAAGGTTVNGQGIGLNALPGDLVFVHDVPEMGIYEIDSSWDRNPNEIEVSSPFTLDIPEGAEISIFRDAEFGVIAMGDIVYMPGSFNNFAVAAPSVPVAASGEYLQIISGPNVGVYEVIEYLDHNRARIAGDLTSHGYDIIPPWNEFTSIHPEDSTQIIEPNNPFIDVDDGDVFIINNRGEESYHYITERVSLSTINIYPGLPFVAAPGPMRYRVLRGAVNPAILTNRQVRMRIDKTPSILDRKAEGSDGHATDASHVFQSSSTNFLALFGSTPPAGYQLRILSGTHARPEPYIISGISGTNGLIIDDSLTEASAQYNPATGFINETSPPNTEVFEVVNASSSFRNLQYRILEDYRYFEEEFFSLPIIAIRDIFTYSPVTGELSDSPLEEGVDYILEVINPGMRYSTREQVRIRFLDSNLAFSRCRIRFYSDPTVGLVDSFMNERGNRVTNNDVICKRMESTFIDVSISVRGRISIEDAEIAINRYITNRPSSMAIEASDIISELYEVGASYVNTDNLLLRMTHYDSLGNAIVETSRTAVGSGDNATYIPGSINITLIPGI